MHSALALAALAAVALANPAPQGVTADITPKGKAPDGCSDTYSGKFQIAAYKASAKRSLVERGGGCGSDGSLTISLTKGQLYDAKGRTGYIASNFQFQFDAPPQAGSLFTGGFSVCTNGSLALGSSAVFYECSSGSFFNLYDRSWAALCEPILIGILPCGSGSGSPAVGQTADGQPKGTAVATAVTQIGDGQAQAGTAVALPISQLADGQPQVPTAKPPPPPITQIGDGQIQAGKATATAAAITQISDGQIQATGTAAPVKTSTASGAVISQIGDGQIQASNSSTSAAAPKAKSSGVAVTNAGTTVIVGSQFAIAVLCMAAIALL